MKHRYIIHPGLEHRRDTEDGPYHSDVALIELYGVPKEQCVDFQSFRLRAQPGDVHLYPRSDGRYGKWGLAQAVAASGEGE